MAFQSPSQIEAYALAGRATLTLQSRKSGEYFTYQITRKKEGNFFFVSVLSGPDSYLYIGILKPKIPQGFDFLSTPKARVKPDAKSLKGFEFFWKWLSADRMPPDMEVRHEGSCGRCGRQLTTPESIDRGIGPECASKMGLE